MVRAGCIFCKKAQVKILLAEKNRGWQIVAGVGDGTEERREIIRLTVPATLDQWRGRFNRSFKENGERQVSWSEHITICISGFVMLTD